MNDLVTPEHRAAAVKLRRLMAKFSENEDLINIGAYRAGSNPEVDLAINSRPQQLSYLQQGMLEPSDFADAQQKLLALTSKWN